MNAPLPGNMASVEDDEWGTFCYTHPDREAKHRMCVEADSFGAEYYNMCDECFNEHKAEIKAKQEDPTQWEHCRRCRNSVPRLSHYRDPDEGMHGPVYEACPDCVSKFWKNYNDYCDSMDDDY